MLVKASEKAVYDKLYRNHIVDYLRNSQEKYDLVLAVDVLVYIGELAPLFSSLRSVIYPGSLFAFSTEITEVDDYSLLQSGRYAYSKTYIRNTGNEYGFRIKTHESGPLRTENGEQVFGNYYIVVKD